MGDQNTDRGFMFDQTGQQVHYATQHKVARVVHRPQIVDDQTFVPFGDPDQPPGVRRDRMFRMLSGDSNATEQEIQERVKQSRQLAAMHQAFQPQLLNPKDPLAIDQLGEQLYVGDPRGTAMNAQTPVIPFIEQFFMKYGGYLGSAIDAHMNEQKEEKDE